MAHRGKFIVIDGIDGTGKATQTELLVKRLRKLKEPVQKIDFPGYERTVFGKLIGECLAGKRGNFVEIDPRIGSALYAADRFESKDRMEEWLASGTHVIADRYVSSNQIHQGGKIKDPKEKRVFLKWLDTVEHGVFGIPRPDLIIYLHLPVSLSVQLISNASAKKKKRYLEGNAKMDVVESNMRYLENARESALEIIKKNNHWVQVGCSRGDEILSREEIHDMVFEKVKKILGIR